MGAAPQTYICPDCGSEVRIGPAGCPRCRAQDAARSKRKKDDQPREKKSWEQDEAYDGISLPEDDFDYDDFVKREFEQGNSAPFRSPPLFLRVVALVVLIAFAYIAYLKIR